MTPSKWEDTLLGISKATEKIRTDDVGWFIYVSDAELGSTTLPMFEFLAKVELKNG